MKAKKVIDYKRTYRSIRTDWKRCALYIIVLILLAFLFLWAHTDDLTKEICRLCAKVLSRQVPEMRVWTFSETYPLFGRVHYLGARTVLPGAQKSLIHAGASLAVILILAGFRKTNRPIIIYLILNGAIHLVNSLWFFFGEAYFPYSLTDYSRLYMLQELGIWTMFFVMTVMITGVMGNKGLPYKLLTVLAVMLYSIVFGTVRYMVFLYFLHRFSMIYMALFYFMIGPMFDFLYLVMIYAVFVNRMIGVYDSRKGKEAWKWL